MLKPKLFILLIFAFLQGCTAQVPEGKIALDNPAFDQKVTSLLSFSVPLMDTDKLAKNREGYTILDAREKEEFDVSHIEGAQYIGYKNFDFSTLENIDKTQPIVVYCSIGYRSEKIGKKLQKEGFTEVYNLYGSLFEWVNDGYELVNIKGEPTKNIHTYNRNWSKWVDNENYKKIW